MAASPIARYLVEIDPRQQPKPKPAAQGIAAAPARKPAAGMERPVFPSVRQPGTPPAAPSGELFHSVDHTKAKVEEAYARGRADALASARAEMDAALAAQKRSFEELLARERDTWAAAESARLEKGFTAALAEIEARIAEAAVRVLGPVLMAGLREQAAASLMEKLQVLLQKDGAGRLIVSGPEDLLRSLRERLAGQSIATVFLPGPSCDVRVEIGPTVLETSLAAWAAQLGLEPRAAAQADEENP